MEEEMKFKKEFLQEMEGKTIQKTIIDHSRWSVLYERVFEYVGKLYCTHYSVGATEQQDEGPYEYEPDEIECQEVKPVEKLVIIYEIIEGN